MIDWKSLFSDKYYLKISAYTILTASILFILYSLFSNFGTVLYTVLDFFRQILSALAPLFVGLIIAYFLSPLVNFIDEKLLTKLFIARSNKYQNSTKIKASRTLSIILSFLIVLATISMIFYTLYTMIIGKIMVKDFDSIFQNIVAYFSKYQDMFTSLSQKLAESGLTENIKDPIQMFFKWVSGGIVTGSDIANNLSKIGGGIFNLFLGTVIAFYILKDQEFFIRLWRKFLHVVLPLKANGRLTEILYEMNIVISKFLRGQLLDALIIAVLSSIALSVVGIDFAIFIGFFAGLANIIPYFGPIIGSVPAVIVALLDGSISKAVLSVVVLLGIQQIDGAVISPRVVGDSTGLHPVFVLLAVIIGGKYFGLVGMLVAVPVAAIIKLFIIKKLT